MRAPPYITFTSLNAFPGIIHAFSVKPSNLEGLCQAVQINRGKVVSAAQTHSNNIAQVCSNDLGREMPQADALITDKKDVFLSIRVADCVPVLLYDPVKMAIGLAHAGWRGSINKITENTVGKMIRAYDCNPSDFTAVIGPCIGKCCYQVGDEVIHALECNIKNWEKYITAGHLDLKALNQDQLLGAGIKRKNIQVCSECTACGSDRFYSYRRDGKNTGRMYAIIGMQQQ